jgi:hypothetical protein
MRDATIASAVLVLLVRHLRTLMAQERPPIIDMHLHADLPPEAIPAGAPALCRPEPCRGEGGATSGSAETLEAMKRYNIVKGFVSGLEASTSTRVFVENTGYPFIDQMIAMMYQYPQLHADVSTMTWVIPRAAFYDYLEALVRAGLGKRLMFGSDQMRWPQRSVKESPQSRRRTFCDSMELSSRRARNRRPR